MLLVDGIELDCIHRRYEFKNSNYAYFYVELLHTLHSPRRSLIKYIIYFRV